MSSSADMMTSRDRFRRSWGRIQPDRWRAVERLDAAGTYLDVGCSSGDYVERLRAEGRTAFGADLLSEAGWQGGVYLQGDATALPVGPGRVDYTMAFEVLEHIPDPVSCLRELARVTRRKLVMSVPNCEVPAMMSQSGVTFHHWVDPTHVNFFTRETLGETLEAAGLAVEDILPINAIRPELLLLSSWRVPSRLKRGLASALEKLPRRVPLHMTLLATAAVADPGGKTR